MSSLEKRAYLKGFRAGYKASENVDALAQLSFQLDEASERITSLAEVSRVALEFTKELMPKQTSARAAAPVLSTPPSTQAPLPSPSTPTPISTPPQFYAQLETLEEKSSLEQALQRLFAAARTDDLALELVKNLCRESHATSPERKTYGQKYVLTKWRNTRTTPSPLGPTAPHLPNPQSADPPEVWAEYFQQYPKSLPKGVRRNAGGPIFSDIVASRIYAHLRPTTPLRVDFATAMTELFTNRGEYKRLVREHNLEIPATQYFAAFTVEDADSESCITPLDVAKHYARCGVSVDQVATVIEPWAKQYAIDHTQARR